MKAKTLIDKNPAAVALGRLGGLVGGKARAERLSPERRKEIAEIAAAARWGNTIDYIAIKERLSGTMSDK